MRQIDFQARWDQSNSYLQPGIFSGLDFFLSPLHALCRKLIMPVSGFDQEDVRRIDQYWRRKWEPEILDSDPHGLHLHYEAIVLNLTSPDGVPIQGTLYRHRRAPTLDVPTVICVQPNAQLSRSDGWDWILKKGAISPQPFNVIVFDYRNCGTSGGTLKNLSDPVIDAETVYQAAVEALHLSEQNIRFLGFSMGGAISAKLAANHPLSGRYVSLNSFNSLGNVIRYAPVFDQVIERIQIPECLKSISGFVRMILGPILSCVGWGLNVTEALEKIKQRTLFVYHPQDPLIPEAAAAVTGVALTAQQAANQVVKLQFKPTVRMSPDDFNHHVAPLSLYEDGRGLSASRRIINYILGNDVFAQRAR
jgi:hypothetical protein